jgi:phosphonate transport system substrate-binding protein
MKPSLVSRRTFLHHTGVLLTGVWWSRLSPVEAGEAPKELLLALTPSQNPTALQESAKPFAEALGKLLGIPIKVYVASDYAAVIEALRSHTVDLAFLHTVGYVYASREAKAKIVAKDIWHGRTFYTSRIWVKKESPYQSLEDLRGKRIAFVDPLSSSGYTYPMVMMIKKGLVQNKDPKTFFKETVFAGSHDAALLALLNGNVDAAASFDLAPQQYFKDERAEQFRYVAETPAIPEAGIAAREGLDPQLVAEIFQALLEFNKPEYQAVLKKLYDIDGFEAAEDKEYDPVRDAVDLMNIPLKK